MNKKITKSNSTIYMGQYHGANKHKKDGCWEDSFGIKKLKRGYVHSENSYSKIKRDIHYCWFSICGFIVK